MGVVTYINDKLSNLVASLGTDRDKASHSEYGPTLVTDEQLVYAYRYAWLPRKIVDIPALDATREWRNWQADAEQISKIEAEESRLDLQRKVKECLTKARLFGGAGIYIGTGDRDPSQPIGQNAQVRHLTVLSRRDLIPGDIDIEPESPRYGKPAWYQVTGSTVQTIHPSRIVTMIGNPLPDEQLAVGREYGWGDSVLSAIYESVRNADATSANVASLIFEAKVDVIRIPDLMAQMADPDFRDKVLERMQLAARGKGINGSLILDKEEEYEQKSASFANLHDLIMTFMQLVSGAADIPMTRLLGQSPGGLQATGDHDTRNYYDRIASMQALEITPALETLDNLIIRQALGSRPPEVWYEWASLWQPDAKQEAEIGASVADAIKKLAETKLIPEDALSRAAVNVLTERGVMPGLEQMVAEVGEDEPDMGERGVVEE